VIFIIDLAMFQSEQIIVPFIFVLAVIFGSLRLVNVFNNKKVDFLIAISLAIFSITNEAFVSMLWSNFGTISIFFIIMFFVLFVIQAFGLRDPNAKAQDKLLSLGVVLFLLIVISSIKTNILSSLPFIGGSDNAFLIIFIVFIVILFWMVMKTGSGAESSGGRR
jgi:hypothetical protein